MNRSPLKELKNQCSTPLGQAHFEGCPAKSVPSSKLMLSQLETFSVGYGKTDTATGHGPKTPLKPSGQLSKPGTPPLTPLANLKVLIAAASSARENDESERREVAKVVEKKNKEEEGGGGGGRKMKSLAILCQKFLSIAEEIGVGTDFSLETMSKKLGTNRRRIYDIINVLEALEMIVKQSKNWYTWLGQENLLITLAKMRAMAEDDTDFRGLLNKENSSVEHTISGSDPLPPLPAPANHDHVSQDGLKGGECKSTDDPSSSFCSGVDETSSTGGGRWDKSLGVLCQKFIMLFLVTPDNEVTLDFAGNVLMPDDGTFSPHPSNPKTKVRRLYDIANVLTTLGLIKKKTFLAPNHRKMPGYSWAGPSLDEIQTISVFRKSETTLYPFYSKRKGCGLGGVSLTRKPSLGSVRPFLHQYEVKCRSRGVSSQPNSAPATPIKVKEAGFKRSLSFGAGVYKKPLPKVVAPPPPRYPFVSPPQQREVADDKDESPPITSTTPSSNGKCVLARQLSHHQVNYLQEVKEFEAEIHKHAHRFPHVAPVFREFVQKFQSTLEQAVAVNGHSIKADGTVPVSCPSSSSSSTASSPSPTQSMGGNIVISPLPTSSTMMVALGDSSGTPPTHRAVMVSPPSAPGSGNATPSVTPTFPVATHGTLSPRSKYTAFTSVENMLINTENKPNSSQLDVVSSSMAAATHPSSFNPNSLLVTASPAYSLYGGGYHPPSTSFLPLSCYSFPLSSVVVPAGVKVGHIRSLAPKSECGGGAGGGPDEASTAPKRPRLDLAS